MKHVTRTVKTLRRDPSNPDTKIDVEIEAAGDSDFDVYYGGQRIGRVKRYTGQASRRLYGRVSVFGKPRMFWKATPPSGREIRQRESMAAAIRWLLPG
jgi:hypothetical protein